MKIRAKILDGEYKDGTIEIEFGKNTHSTKVRINGHEVNNCRRITITLDANRGYNIANFEFFSMPEVEEDDNTEQQQDNA